jgi:hypothetical protein
MAKHKLVFDATDADTLAASDSVGAFLRSADGTLLTHTTVSGKESLDVNVTQSALPTGAATETTLASLLTELQTITHAEDAAHASGDAGVMALVVRNDAGGSLVSADGDYAPLQVDANGNLRVAGNLTVTEPDVYAEDSAHTDGDEGGFVLAVRKDAMGSMVSADGDYAPFQVNALGELRTVDIANVALAAAAESSTTTSAALITTPLANRKEVKLYNNGSKTVWVGPSGVSTATGFPLFPGSVIEMKLGSAVAIHSVATAGTQDIRVLQMS